MLKNQILALVLNLWAWALSLLGPRRSFQASKFDGQDGVFVSIPSPGGLDKLELKNLGVFMATQGYNVPEYKKGDILVDTSVPARLPADAVVVKINFFSVNYADIAIRWGLYESALR